MKNLTKNTITVSLNMEDSESVPVISSIQSVEKSNNESNHKNSNEFILNQANINVEEFSKLDTQCLLEQNYKYFLEYSKLSEANAILKNELNSLLKEKNFLKHSIAKLEGKGRKKNENNPTVINDTYTNRKRHRRSKNEISRRFQCDYPDCHKSYGSEGSLNQHIKLKHDNTKHCQ